MDAISSSTGIVWLFVFICTYLILLLIFSMAIWFYVRCKRLAFTAYIADIILTALILAGTIDNTISRISRGGIVFRGELFFLFLSAVLIILSIGFYRKNKRGSNISMNAATILGVMVCIHQIQAVNM